VTRRCIIDNSVVGPDQAVSLDDAIRAVTINAARQIGQGDRLGSLEKGKEADFTILEMGERAARYCVIPRSRVLVQHMIVRRLPLPWPGPFGTARSLRFQNPAMWRT
jgi:adenine deaminase